MSYRDCIRFKVFTQFLIVLQLVSALTFQSAEANCLKKYPSFWSAPESGLALKMGIAAATCLSAVGAVWWGIYQLYVEAGQFQVLSNSVSCTFNVTGNATGSATGNATGSATELFETIRGCDSDSNRIAQATYYGGSWPNPPN